MFIEHAKWLSCQFLLAIGIMANSKRGSDELKHYFAISLFIGGTWIFPIIVTKRIKRITRPTEYLGDIVHRLLQISVCMSLFIFTFKPSLSWTFIACICSIPILLMIFSTKRAPKNNLASPSE